MNLEIAASVINADRLHAVELICEKSRHNIRDTRCATDAQNSQFADTPKFTIQL